MGNIWAEEQGRCPLSDFGDVTYPAARKQHRCEYCYGPIPKGEIHPQFKGMWDNEWQNWRMHNECYDIYSTNYDYNDGFMPGDGEMPERIKVLLKGGARC